MEIDLEVLAPLAGRWQFRQKSAIYEGPQENAWAPFGLAISSQRLRNGRIRATVAFPKQHSVGRIVFGRNAKTNAYFSAGIGGYGYAYLLDEFTLGRGWRALRTEGGEQNISAATLYDIEVQLRGQRVRLLVNSIAVLEGNLPSPLNADQIGLFAYGDAPVEFSKFVVDIDDIDKPHVFVVMHFGEPYDTLYRDVITPVATEMGFAPYRADDVYHPGSCWRT